MKIFLRNRIDVSEYVDYNQLGPFESIITAIRQKFYDMKFVKQKRDQKLMKEEEERSAEIEQLKEAVFHHIRLVLLNNNQELLKSEGKKAEEVYLLIDRKFDDILDTIVDSSEFLAFNISRCKENLNLQVAYPDMPILIRVSKKAN